MPSLRKKPGIPSVPTPKDDRSRFDSTTKECLEYIMGRSGNKLKGLNRDSSTLPDVIDKINEILDTLQ